MGQQSRKTAIAPWEALGFVKQDLKARAKEVIAGFDAFKLWGCSPPPVDSPHEVEHWTFGVHLEASMLFAMGALGYTIDHPVLQDWREAGRQLVAAVSYYLFGPWKEMFRAQPKVANPFVEQAPRTLRWIDYYREALPIALSLNDWTSADRLLEFPGPDLRLDDGFNHRTAEDNAYHIWLALRLRGESGSEVDARRDLIARRSRPRPKLLALAADALFAGKPEQFAKTLTDYLKHYQEREIDLRRRPGERLVRDGICLDGTTLWHLARRRGLGEIQLPEELMIMIAQPSRSDHQLASLSPRRRKPAVRAKLEAKPTSPTPAWKALGFKKRDVDLGTELLSTFQDWGSQPNPTKQADRWELADKWVSRVHVPGTITFELGALGYTIKHPLLKDWREAGRQAVIADLYYFFGPWREKKFLHDGVVINPEQARARLKWMGRYRESLSIAVALSDWKSADRLLEYPGPDVKVGQVAPEGFAYQIWLAMRHRGESGSEVDSRRDLIARCSQQRPKLLARAADALFAGEPEQLAKTLADYLKCYRQELERDRDEHVVVEGISLDGTVLWHLARRRGLGEIKLPEELMIMIARP